MIAVTSQWPKEEEQAEVGHAQGPERQSCTSPLLRRARPVCGSVLLQDACTGALGAWGDARGAFVCASTAGLSSSISIWVRAHGAAPAGVGEVTL